MPVEGGGFRPRPVGQVNLAPDFRAGGGLPVAGGNDRRGRELSDNAVMSPIAANLVRLMEQAREGRQRRGFSGFYPHWWMYNKILEVEVEQGIGEDKPELRNFLFDIKTAYAIAAYPQFTPRQKNRFREILREDIREENIGNVTLNDRQRKLLTELATATNTPIDPAQETYHYFTVLQQPEIREEEMREDPRYNT